MRIIVDKIPDEGFTVDLATELEGDVAPVDLGHGQTVRPRGRPEGTVQVYRTDGGVIAHGHLRQQAKTVCSRCLAELELPVDADLDAVYMPRDEVAEDLDDAEVELSADEALIELYDGEEVDLRALVDEQFALAIPQVPLCRTDCKGLCPRCGRDWNEAPCACEPERPASPFDKLKDLKLS